MLILLFKLSGCGFGEHLPLYLRKFVHTEEQFPELGNFYLTVYAVGLFLPSDDKWFLPDYNSMRSAFTDLKNASRNQCVILLAVLRILLAVFVLLSFCRAIAMPPGLLSFCRAIALIQAVPRIQNWAGYTVGTASLTIYLLHEDIWFIKALISMPVVNGADCSHFPVCAKVGASMSAAAACVAFTCMLAHLSPTRLGFFEGLGYIVVWQGGKQVARNYHVVHSLAEACAMLLLENGDLLFFVAFCGVIVCVCKANLFGASSDLPAGMERAVKWVNKQNLFHENPIVNACYVLVQLYVLYYVLTFIEYTLWENTCAVKITLSGIWTDVTSSAIVKADIDINKDDCNGDAVAEYRQNLKDAVHLTEEQLACVTFWSLTQDLNCPIPAKKEQASKDAFEKWYYSPKRNGTN